MAQLDRMLFDVDALRTLDRRHAFVRTLERPTLVLGSTQDAGIVDTLALERHGVELVRRRSGGGAVLVEPGLAVWVDTWIPRDDPLFDADVGRSRSWVGRWWAETLGEGVEVHGRGPIESRWSGLICFAGIDSGEVLHRGRKVVGVAQWRARQGALTHSFAYREARWDLLAELLGLGANASTAARALTASTATVRDVLGARADSLCDELLARLPEPPSWSIEGVRD
jgi:lipoate-protein ligase A